MLLRLCGLRQAKIGSLFPNIHLIYRSTRGRLKRFSNTASFHTGRDDVAEEQGQTGLQENGWEPWPDAKNWTRARTNQVDDKNIVVDDLNATLDAHQTANRIRKVMFSGLIYRPLSLSGQKALRSKLNEGNVNSQEVRRSAPASGQDSKSRKDKEMRNIEETPLPNKSWALDKECVFADKQSPWLTFVEHSATCGNERFVWRLKHLGMSDHDRTGCPRR